MKLKSNSGQIVVEYILLLAIAVSCSVLLVKGLISRAPGSEGVIIMGWSRILTSLGSDMPGCQNQKNFKTPNCPP